MSRRRKATKRQIMPDPKFNDKIVSKFTSCLMYDGKRSTAEKIVYGAFEVIQKKVGAEAVKVFHEALENVQPQLVVRSEEHTSELSHTVISYAVFCLKKKNKIKKTKKNQIDLTVAHR